MKNYGITLGFVYNLFYHKRALKNFPNLTRKANPFRVYYYDVEKGNLMVKHLVPTNRLVWTTGTAEEIHERLSKIKIITIAEAMNRGFLDDEPLKEEEK